MIVLEVKPLFCLCFYNVLVLVSKSNWFHGVYMSTVLLTSYCANERYCKGCDYIKKCIYAIEKLRGRLLLSLTQMC